MTSDAQVSVSLSNSDLIPDLPNTTEVAYNNNLNSVPVGALSESEQNLFFAILTQVKNTGSSETVLSFNQIRKLSKFSGTSVQALANSLYRMSRKLQQMTIQTVDVKAEKITLFTLFPTFQLDLKKKTLSGKVNEELQYLVNNLTVALSTEFDIAFFTNIKSKYSKTAFRLAKEKERSGFAISLDEFKKIFGIPATYRPSDINGKVLRKINEELSGYFTEFNVEPVTARVVQGKGRPRVVAIAFSVGTFIGQDVFNSDPDTGQISLELNDEKE